MNAYSHKLLFCPAMNHVTNLTTDDIFVNIDLNVRRSESVVHELKEALAKIKAGDEIEYKTVLVHKASWLGFTAIAPGRHLLFRPGHAEVKYVSIFLKSPINGRLVACTAFPIDCNRSVFVDEEGYVRLAKMGTIDEDDNEISQ